ncbi:MAG: acyl-CoA dehydrogenase family protein [Kibdelosporangium sp.]
MRQSIEDFEAYLGNPHTDVEFSYERCARLDAAEEFPAQIIRLLNDWGLHHHYVPAEFGGALTDFVTPPQLIRAVARRDLTVAIAHGKTFLGGVSAWVAPVTGHTRALAGKVLGGHPVSWGLTEREHGSDLLAGEVTADAVTGGYRISGEKWLINNATQGRVVTVLARSDRAGGARGFDVFVVDKHELPAESFRCLPKVRTDGIRGADISGISFDGAMVPTSARLGEPGTGLEIVLKGLQLTRTLCSALSLGAGDHALALAMSFAGNRSLYDRVLIELPRARRVLANAYADHLLNEVLAVTGVRSIHTMPGDLGLVSAIVKYLLPTRTDKMLTELGRLLGVRSQLADGRFEKLARDHRIVGIFDGNTVVNLRAIINAFPMVARRDDGDVAGTFDLGGSLPPLDRGKLSLMSRHGCRIIRSLPRSVARLAELAGARPELVPVARLAQDLLERSNRTLVEVAAYRPTPVRVPRRAFTLAEQFALDVAGAAAIGVWLANHEAEAGSPFWRHGIWLHAVLARSLSAPSTVDADDALLAELSAQYAGGRSFSLTPHRLAEGMRS